MFSMQDLEKGDARLFGKARKQYEALGDRLTAAGAALDVFACSLDQVGLAEMRPAVSDSGDLNLQRTPPQQRCDMFKLAWPGRAGRNMASGLGLGGVSDVPWNEGIVTSETHVN